MVQRLIVPVDGSHESWRAIRIAVALARKCDAPIDVVEVVLSEADRDDAARRVTGGVDDLDYDDVEIAAHVELGGESVAAALADVLERHPESTIVMSSHGRGRSAALLGSVTEDLLQREYGPVVVVGPHANGTKLDGPLLVTVDGSDLSEMALPLAGAWAIELGVTPWVIEVNEPSQVSSEHLVESSYVARLARHVTEQTRHQTEFEVLHGKDPHVEVAEYATSVGASLIVATTHGRTGLSRLRIGSTAANFVRLAPCPVLLVRPPRIHDAES